MNQAQWNAANKGKTPGWQYSNQEHQAWRDSHSDSLTRMKGHDTAFNYKNDFNADPEKYMKENFGQEAWDKVKSGATMTEYGGKTLGFNNRRFKLPGNYQAKPTEQAPQAAPAVPKSNPQMDYQNRQLDMLQKQLDMQLATLQQGEYQFQKYLEQQEADRKTSNEAQARIDAELERQQAEQDALQQERDTRAKRGKRDLIRFVNEDEDEGGMLALGGQL